MMNNALSGDRIESPAQSRSRLSPLDRFISSRAALKLAFGWGFAEATFFFLVPDVLLTFLSCRELRPALKATVTALAGALAGGAIIYAFGSAAPDAARSFLDHVPAINPALISSVESQISRDGLLSVLLGPLKGIPYKIYAVEWGARGGSFIGFMLISIPARYLRFLLTALVARGIARIIEPWTHRAARIEVLIFAITWVGFYGLYFSRFGF